MTAETVSPELLLSTTQMASFAARGFLRFDGLVDSDINQRILDFFDAGPVERPAAGVPLSAAYAAESPLHELMNLPAIQGIVQSLVGPDPIFDHHAVHIRQPNEGRAQGLHGDAIIDTRMHFDIQLMYFPHDTPLEMGGTLLLPGSQFRRINESDIARYQNFVGQIPVVCEAGTVLALHHGIWHCGRRNQTDRVRYMFKIRLNPTVKQLRLWNTADLEEQMKADPTTNVSARQRSDESIYSILSRPEPWYEFPVGRLEIVNRVKFWRFLTGSKTFDLNFWLTRLENQPERLVQAA